MNAVTMATIKDYLLAHNNKYNKQYYTYYCILQLLKTTHNKKRSIIKYCDLLL